MPMPRRRGRRRAARRTSSRLTITNGSVPSVARISPTTATGPPPNRSVRRAGDRHGERGADALRRHQQARRERRLPAVDLVVERQEDHRAEQRGADEERGRRRGAERRVAEQAHVEQRPVDAQRVEHERGDEQRAADDRDPHDRRGEAAVRLALRQPEHDRRRGRARAAAGRAGRAGPRPRARGRACRKRCASTSASTTTGRFTKKIQRHETVSTSRPPMTGPKIGPSSIGTPTTRHDAADPVRAGDLRHQAHPDRHDHAAAEALEDAEDDQRLGRPRQPAQRRAERRRARPRPCTRAWRRSARTSSRSAGSPTPAPAGSPSRPTGSCRATRAARATSISSATLTIVVSRIDMITPTITTAATR